MAAKPNRRSNRIASQLQSRLLSPSNKGGPADSGADNTKPVRRRQRQIKVRNTTTHAAATSNSSIGRNISPQELANCLVPASDIAPSCDWDGGCFLVCHDCRFATVRLDVYSAHVAACGRAAADAHKPLQVYRCPHCAAASESRSWVTSHAGLMSEHLALGHPAAQMEDLQPHHNSDDGGPAPEVADAEAAGPASPRRLHRCPALRPANAGRRSPHVCADCGKRFGMRYCLMRHRSIVHETAGTAVGAAAADSAAAAAAAKPRQGRSKPPSPSSSSIGGTAVACRLCSKLFKSRRSYLVHRLAFHPTAAAEASAASAVVTDATAPTAAEDANCLLVTDPEPFKCRYCDLKFAQKTVFLRHQARDHPGERPFTCGECGRGFKFQHSLAMHQRLHRGELTCLQCSRVFHSDREYNEHQASVHEGSVTFLCEFCGRTFPTQYKLSRHGRVHNRSRQHACPQCGRHFHRMDKLKLHLQCVHSTDRPHLCHLCGRAFNRRDKLAEHVKQHSVHRCPACPAAFPTRTDLRRHTAAEHRAAAQKRRAVRRTAKVTAADKAAQPSEPLPRPQPPTSPLGDALITIANGLDLQHQQQSQQIIFLESFDQLHPHQSQHQNEPHQLAATLTLYSPLSGAYYTTIAGVDAAAGSSSSGVVGIGGVDSLAPGDVIDIGSSQQQQ